MIENSKKSVFLIDHKKLDIPGTRIMGDLSYINIIITDLSFSDEIKAKFHETIFIEVETPKTQR